MALGWDKDPQDLGGNKYAVRAIKLFHHHQHICSMHSLGHEAPIYIHHMEYICLQEMQT